MQFPVTSVHPEQMVAILNHVQINMPYRLLKEKYLSLVLDNGINPEIGFDCFVLDHYDKEDFQRTADILADAELKITFHSPFYDLRPGALDPKVREITIYRFEQLFELAGMFKPDAVVCHAAFEHRFYASHEEEWLENSIKTWEYAADLAQKAGTIITLENTFEERPDYFGRLLDRFKGDSRIKCCFDTGHCNAFSDVPFQTWTERIGWSIGQIHVHDNDGSGDMHLPPGKGNFPFTDFFRNIKKYVDTPIITLEPHTEGDLWEAIAALSSMKLLED
ncbi:MAG: sugar phosphate isomerase/epimerase [Syntrophales bacterium]|jgi:sugar phosphate isomerase/epimerase|nr:sugar phosphate isomerase/epimerase [Syntrophales bacterium]MDY0044971.1 sugar phosphate isomerase/epimerase family protein [Syntrophales bacterium]